MVNAWWDKRLRRGHNISRGLQYSWGNICPTPLSDTRGIAFVLKLSRQSFELIKKQSKEWGNDVGDVHPYLVDEELYQVFVLTCR